ncbi:tetratricopeptide repeat protein [Paraburkholderia sp. BCC1884]|uniref:tetratricopeptide repeat protein n=1 Tax=Paraburkholderia sp. BCC1884 TaxID=2562668 RepID=UPI0021B3AB3B|nr:tetratricopeptide repeat protein [Paraburkholderia sp. BCC1884]
MRRGLHAAGVIARGPKQLWPYVLPWMVVALAVWFAGLAVNSVFTRQLLVPPVDTPNTLVERGYSSTFLAQRIMASMLKIAKDGDSVPHDAMSDSETQPDIQIPGENFSYATVVRFLKSALKRADVVVHIGITKVDNSADTYVAHVQIENGPFDTHDQLVPFEGRDLEKFVSDIATASMHLAEPNLLASHLFSEVQKTHCSPKQCNYAKVDAIYDEVLNMPASDQVEWALAGKTALLVSRKQPQEAERQAREALKQYPKSAILYANLGLALEQEDRVEEALDALQTGANEKSATGENLRLLGDVLLHAHLDQWALDAFKKADRRLPNSVYVLHDWGEALVKVGQYDEAIDKLDRAVALSPELAPAYAELGRALDHEGDLRAASHRYAQALQRDPGSLKPQETQLARLDKDFQTTLYAETAEPDESIRAVSERLPPGGWGTARPASLSDIFRPFGSDTPHAALLSDRE